MKHTSFANQCQVSDQFPVIFYFFLLSKIVMNCCPKNDAERAKYEAEKCGVCQAVDYSFDQ